MRKDILATVWRELPVFVVYVNDKEVAFFEDEDEAQTEANRRCSQIENEDGYTPKVDIKEEEREIEVLDLPE